MAGPSPSSRRSVLRGALLGAPLAGGTTALGSGGPAAAASGSASEGVLNLALDRDTLLRARARGRSDTLRTGPMPVPAYSLVGVSWDRPRREDDAPTVLVRTGRAGRWSLWLRVRLQHDAPDHGTEGFAAQTATVPLWTGPADGVDVMLRGAGTRPVLHLVDPGHRTSDLTVGRRAGHHHDHHHGHQHHGPRGPRTAPMPAILPRSAWGAREGWRDGGPWYNHTIRQVHVHHTATGNGYAAADVPALIRGIYGYHTHVNGWSDIAYNFLVDRFGRVWEGRYGGVDRPVRGAHTLGFNHSSTGVAVLGSYDQVDPGHHVVTALAQLAAWKLDGYGRSPAGWTAVRSAGSDRYAAGQRLELPVVDGHRDTNDTECPGGLLYAQLQPVRARAQARADRFDPRDGR